MNALAMSVVPKEVKQRARKEQQERQEVEQVLTVLRKEEQAEADESWNN